MRTDNLKFAVLLVLGAVLPASAQQGSPPTRTIDFIPPEWTQFNINWKPSWDETLAANKEQDWQQELSQNKALIQAAGQIVGLRKIELLKAMIQRFPAEKNKHAEAYRTIADIYQQIGLRWWSSYYGWKLAREFPQRKDLLPDAYMRMISWQFGNPLDPEWRDWEFALYEALALADAGVIPNSHPALPAACLGVQDLIVQERRYDEFLPQLNRFEKLGTQVPAVNNAAARLLCSFGHIEKACGFDAKSGPINWRSGDLNVSSVGKIRNMPRNFELETRWAALLGGLKLRGQQEAISPDDVQGILDLGSRTDAYLAKSNSHYVSFQVMVDQMLTGMHPDRLADLRTAQEKAAQPLAEAVRLTGDWDELILAFRRYPWARSLQELLVEFGEQSLRDGRSQWATAAFQGVIMHASDLQLRLEAQVGLWLSLAQEPGNRKALEAAMAAIADNEQLPWRGGQETAGNLKKELLAAIAAGEEAKPLNLSELRRRRVELPSTWPAAERHAEGPVLDFGLHSPWPVSQLQAAGEALFVIGPDRVACFGAAGGRPVWVHTPADGPDAAAAPWDAAAAANYLRQFSQRMEFDRRPVTLRSERSPAVSEDGRALYCLLNRQLPAVVALDAATGKQLWSTAARPEWKDLTPMSHPAASEGRVYVLAIPSGLGRGAGMGPGKDAGPPVLWHLVCLDGQYGHILWKRLIGWQAHTLLDLARCSSAVTIHQGAAYCSTNMGIVARCDIRDGMVQWVRGYSSAVTSDPHSSNFSREGPSPLVMGQTLLLAPRDHSGVLAFRSDTGEQLWEAIMVPSDKVVGVCGSAIVVMNEQWLSALDLASGRPLWYRRLPEGTGSQAALVRQEVVVVSDGRLQRLSAATGKTVEELQFVLDMTAECGILEDGTLIEIKAPGLAGDKSKLAPAPSVALGIPLEEVWTLPCEKPMLLLPNSDQASDRFCVLSGRRLGCVRMRPAWEVAWERLLHRQPRNAVLQAGQVFLAAEQEVSSLNAIDGARRWSVRVPFLPYYVGGTENLAFAATANNASTAAAVIDAAAGKLLWSRPFGERMRSQSNIRGATLLREGGPETLRLFWPRMLFGAEGYRLGETILDARSGQIRQIRQTLPLEESWPAGITLDSDAIRYIGRDAMAHVVPWAGGQDQAAQWDQRFDLRINERYPASIGLHAGPSGLYVQALGQLFFFDPGSKRELLYELPDNPQTQVVIILDFREAGDKLVVVSGVTGEVSDIRGLRMRQWGYDPNRSRISVDVFDRATGQHLGRQELAGIPCYDPYLAGYKTQAKIFDSAIVVSAPDGVHVFMPHPAGAKAFADVTADIRAFREMVTKGGVAPQAFNAANTKANEGLMNFQKAVGPPSRPRGVSEAGLAEMAKRIADEIAAIRTTGLRPMMSPPAGGFVDASSVVLSTAVSGAEIRYTLDGSDPVTKGKVYDGPVPLSGSIVIKAVADLPGKTKADSPTAEAAYRKVEARPADNVSNLRPGLAFAHTGGRFRLVADVIAAKAPNNGTCKTFDITPWLLKDQFAVTFTGYINVPIDGAYTFYLTSDDGSQLYIGDKLVTDNDRHHPPQTRQGEIGLRAGFHPIKVVYFEEIGGEDLTVEYEGPGIKRQKVPASVLFRTP